MNSILALAVNLFFLFFSFFLFCFLFCFLSHPSTLNKCGENLILKNLESRLIDGTSEKLDEETKQDYSLCVYITF